MKKLTNKQRCKNCIHKRVCPYQSFYAHVDGLERCTHYKPKERAYAKKQKRVKQPCGRLIDYEDKQIKEMARIMNEVCNVYDEQGNHIRNKCHECEEWSDDNHCCCSYNRKEAKALYDAGYRKQSEHVIELPCNLNAGIWYIDKNYTIQKAEVSSIIIKASSRHILAVRYVWETEETIKLALRFENLNIDYWLTKEEAEKALAKMKGGENNA